MAAAIIMAGRCNWCSRPVSPHDLFNFSTGQAMCQRCHEWHGHALGVLAGEMPRGCQECGLTREQLNAFETGPTTRMYVVMKDGIYQVLCMTCKNVYCAKRADLYRGTEFGARLKL
jgi:hypothetical protein